MSAGCCQGPHDDNRGNDARHRTLLWVVLAINAAMFLLEIALEFASRSVALRADALDFPGDAANYGLRLSVAGLALRYRARAALVKGISMGLFGTWIAGSAIRHFAQGTVPEPVTLGVVGGAALIANALSFALLSSMIMGMPAVQGFWIVARAVKRELPGAGA